GRLLEAVLTDAGVDLNLARRTQTPTGAAIITVDASGENSIVVAPSANSELTLSAEATDAVAEARVVLAPLEIPFETVRAVAAAGRYVILNAAPAASLDDDLLADVDLLVVNEHEAAVVSGVEGGLDVTGPALLRRVPAVVVTLGGDGALILRHNAP